MIANPQATALRWGTGCRTVCAGTPELHTCLTALACAQRSKAGSSILIPASQGKSDWQSALVRLSAHRKRSACVPKKPPQDMPAS